ncbi:MAG: 50S ribosomal protein L6 [Chloroflexota bacterium]
MSRIGRMPIAVPKNVKVAIDGSTVSVSGAKGTLSETFHPDIQIELQDGAVVVRRTAETRQQRALHGLTRALLNNMVTGVHKGFSKNLEIEGVGYRAEMDGKTLVLYAGYSHPVRIEPPANVQFAVENKNRTIVIAGIDKQVVGEAAAQIRKVRPPEPYKGKGIRYAHEVVRRKAGKTGKV